MADGSSDIYKYIMLPIVLDIGYFVSGFPPYPSILFSASRNLFMDFRGLGVLIGLIVGLLLTKGTGKLVPGKWPVAVVGILAVLTVVLGIIYFRLLKSPENHFDATLVVFFVVSVLGSAWVVLAVRPLVWLVGMLAGS